MPEFNSQQTLGTIVSWPVYFNNFFLYGSIFVSEYVSCRHKIVKFQLCVCGIVSLILVVGKPRLSCLE